MAIEKSSVFAFAARTVRTREARTLTGTFLKAGLLVFLLSPALAQTTDLDSLNAAVKSAQSAGDNAWMLTSAALVLMMTGPGLALFYGGLVRKKNVLGTMMQSFVLMAIITVLWALVGYSLAFGTGTSFIGGFQYLFLQGVDSSPNPDYAATIPHQTFMVYQLMFAIITPALDYRGFCGADEIQRHGPVHCTVGPVSYIFRWRTWCGAKEGLLNAFLGEAFLVLISPEARWCILPRAFPRWFAPSIWVSVWGIPQV